MPVPAGRVMGPLPQPPSGPEIRPESHMPPAGGRMGPSENGPHSLRPGRYRDAGFGWTITTPSPLPCPVSSDPAGRMICPAPLPLAGSSTCCAAPTARSTRVSPTTCPSGCRPTLPAGRRNTPAAGFPSGWPTASPRRRNRRP